MILSGCRLISILIAWGNTVRALGFSWITLSLLFFPSRKRQYYLIGLSFSCLVNSTQQIDLHSKRSTYYLAEKLFVGFGAHRLDGDGLRGSPPSLGGFPLGLVGGKWSSYLRVLESVYFLSVEAMNWVDNFLHFPLLSLRKGLNHIAFRQRPGMGAVYNFLWVCRCYNALTGPSAIWRLEGVILYVVPFSEWDCSPLGSEQGICLRIFFSSPLSLSLSQISL